MEVDTDYGGNCMSGAGNWTSQWTGTNYIQPEAKLLTKTVIILKAHVLIVLYKWTRGFESLKHHFSVQFPFSTNS